MKLFGEAEWTWDSREKAVEGIKLGPYEYLASRIDNAQVEAMIAAATVKPADSGEVAHESRASKNKGAGVRGQESGARGQGSGVSGQEAEPLKPEIAFADFDRLDLRIGMVKSCETVPKSSKLLRLILDCGALGERVIFSGIRQAYPDPAALVGKEVVFVANLAPRRMSVGVSEGMVLFAGEPGSGGGVVLPESSAGAGARVS